MTEQYKMVPVLSTVDMTKAAMKYIAGIPTITHDRLALAIDSAIAAAPDQPYPVEPDFYLWGDEVVWRYSPEINQCIREQGTPLFAHPPKVPVELLDREAIRNAALEEAAKECYRHAESLKKTFSDTEQWALVRGAVMASGEMIRALKSQPAQPSDTEMLDWITENRAIVDYYGNGYRVCFIDDGSFYPEVYPTIQEAIKAAMKADREG